MKYLSLSALVYGVLFIINLLYGNTITLTIQSGLGAVLFIATAVYVNTLDGENSTAHTKLEQEIARLNKEIEEIKKKQ